MIQKAAGKLSSAPIACLVVICLLLATACSALATPVSLEPAATPAQEEAASEEGPSVQVASARRFCETSWFWGIVALVPGAIGGYLLWVRSIEARTRLPQDQAADRTKELAALNAIAAVVSRSLDQQHSLRMGASAPCGGALGFGEE